MHGQLAHLLRRSRIRRAGPLWVPTSPDLWLRSRLGVSGDPIDSQANQGTVADSWTAATTARPTVGDVAGKASVEFDGSNDQLLSGSSAGAYKALHDGAGGAILAIVHPVASTAGANAIISTGRPLTSQIGTTVAWDDAADRMQVWTTNGAAYCVNANSGTNSVPTEATAMLGFRIDSGATNDFELWVNGVISTVGSFANAVSASNESSQSRVGLAAGAGGFPFNGHVLDIVAWLSSVSDTQWADEQGKAGLHYGLAIDPLGLDCADILAMGQSNIMAVPTRFTETPPADLEGPDVFVSNGTHAVVADVDSGADSPPGIGVLLGRLARQIIDTGRYKRVRFACGIQSGASITTFIPGQTNYVNMKARAEAISLQPKRFVYDQGEEDYGMDQSTYEGHLTNILDTAHTDWSTLRQVILVRTADGACGNDTSTVRAAQTAVANGRTDTKLVDIDDIWADHEGSDGCHFYIEGYDDIGLRIAPDM